MPRRSTKLTPAQIERKAKRDALLLTVGEAIAEGRAYLDTFVGHRKVTGYNDATGWAMTKNDGEGWASERSFMVCLEDIKMDSKPADVVRSAYTASGQRILY